MWVHRVWPELWRGGVVGFEHGTTQHGTARHIPAHRITAHQSTTYSIAQHITAQHSTTNRQIFGGCTAPKYLTEGVPSIIWGVYSPQIFDGWRSVKYLGGVQPPNI